MPRKGAPSSVAATQVTRLDEVLDLLGVPDWQRSPLKVNYNAKCPTHGDKHASLSVGRDRDDPTKIVLNCHATCSPKEVRKWFEKPDSWFREAKGWTPKTSRKVRGKGTPVESYPYYDLAGTELYRQTRYLDDDGSKNWSVEHFVDTRLEPGKGSTPDVLYNWPAVEAAIGTKTSEIFVVEGEKDVETLRSWQQVGTTALSGNWTTEMLSRLSGAQLVTVVADRDQKGYEQAHRVTSLLDGLSIPFRVVQSRAQAAKADVTDHLQAGFRFDDLEVIEDVEALALELDVLKEIRRVRVREEAQRRLSAQLRRPIPTVVSLTELLATEDEQEQYRVDRVWPAEGHVLLSAQYKAGKTTLRDNWLKAQVDEHRFLNAFDVTPLKGRIGVLDFEMGDKKNRRHLRQMGVMHPDAVDFLDMRGVASSLNLLDSGSRREWLALITAHDWETVVLDPISPALVALGLDENSNKDVRTFLNAWEELLAEAGIYESLVIHHSGHSGDRSRGAAAFRDWPSAYWDLNRERDKNGDTDDSAPSYFKAKGRDVDYPESELVFEKTTLSLTIDKEGSSRKAKRSAATVERKGQRTEELYEEIKKWLAGNPGRVSKRAWREAATGTDAEKDRVYDMAELQGLLTRHISRAPRRRSEGV